MILKQYYKQYDHCRFCSYPLTNPVIDLGTVPLAGGFLKSKADIAQEKLFPLTLAFCENCFLLQTREVIDANILFKNYFYASSAIKTLVIHFEELAGECQQLFPNPQNKLIVEIGCNDGAFLKAVQKKGFRVLGVDPATNIVTPLIKQSLPIKNDYFTVDVSKEIQDEHGKADIIFSANTLAHIEDMHTVMKGVENLLNDDGIFIMQVHYLGNLIKELQYDMIYHEHQYYYSVHTLKKFLEGFNLKIYDVKFNSVHAGSLRMYVCKKDNKKKPLPAVAKILKQEEKDGLLKKETFVRYNKKIKKTKQTLLQLLDTLKKNGQTIAGYGASGRGTIIMNYCGLTNKYLEYVIDDAPAKQNAFTPGNHLRILSSTILQTKKRPDYVVLFAWSFLKEIKQRNQGYLHSGGKFILPLPEVKIVDS